MCLVLLMGVCFFLDFMARLKMRSAEMFALMDDRTIREMKVIDFIHQHWWFVAVYILIFWAALLRLEFRSASRGIVWLSFSLFALPLFAYCGACAHISNKILVPLP